MEAVNSIEFPSERVEPEKWQRADAG